MPSIVVADANVFVFLINAGAFETVFHKSKIQIFVPQAVVDEIKLIDYIDAVCDEIYARSIEDDLDNYTA